MATVGDQLTAPEAGWKRYNDTDTNICYIGSWGRMTSLNNFWNGDDHVVDAPNGKSIKLRFMGSKIRLIDQRHTNRCSSLQAIIDGTAYDFSENGKPQCQTIVFEKLGLDNTIHMVEFTSKVQSSGDFCIDAIDIDDTGELLPILDDPSNLIAIAGDSQVALSWTAVTGATGYNVKRSTTAGGPYTTVGANVSTNSYLDTTVTNGTTYYYVVTAVSADSESCNSNEASATPEGENLLRITMNDSSEREYEVNTTEFNSFLAWFNRAIGTGTSYYSFDKTVGKQSSTEYLVFDKIISFKTTTIDGQVVLKIIMSDSSEREYKVSSTNDFVNWHNRTVAPCSTGTTHYEFTDGVDGSTEYLSFDKIISFEVMPLTR
ncbi:hypothetical protein Ga0466249_004048 [Sporomusaceae bacterium BoRhaA]|uniref:hypothetical protein n=1 Tax=Pelorhabdus rhamnosifermentans TaxID=2772457 RepID=UPI001C061D75|nr:hypothetical protein [Pelorhabdus rhamnosifermentans]MBU2702913.1 hypothetical protein [Pelorhabdus rhamnosifermentans]